MALPSTVVIDQARVRGLIGSRLESNLAGTGVAYVTTSDLPDEPGAATADGEHTGPTARIVAIDHDPDTRRPGDSAALEPIRVTIDVTAPRRTQAGVDHPFDYTLEAAMTTVVRALGWQAIDDDSATGHIVRLWDATRTPDPDPWAEAAARTGVVQVRGQVVRSFASATTVAPGDGEADLA